MPHRKVYRKHYGPIPREPSGKSYHIHHIDGVHTNNDPKNLVALTAREHFDRHLKQGDYQAALRLAENIHLTYNEQSELARLANLKRIAEGRHNWCNNGEYQREQAVERKKNGTCHFTNMHATGLTPAATKLSCIKCRTVLSLTGLDNHAVKCIDGLPKLRPISCLLCKQSISAIAWTRHYRTKHNVNLVKG